MRLTTKEVSQLLQDIIEESDPNQQALLIKDRSKVLLSTNPDLLERLTEIAWDEIFGFDPEKIGTMEEGHLQWQIVKERILELGSQGITGREIVQKTGEPKGYYKLFDFEDLIEGYGKLMQSKSNKDLLRLEKEMELAKPQIIASRERVNTLGALEELMEFFLNGKEPTLPNPEPKQGSQRSKVITLRQIALIHALEEKTITAATLPNIAKELKFVVSPTTLHKLYQLSNNYKNTGDLKARPNPCTRTTLKNKIELFESVLSKLSPQAKEKAQDILKILKKYDPEDAL